MTAFSPEEEKKAQETLKALTELKEKTEILSEHVENRKAALEEEIEESLHEAIHNARDSLERVQENLEPKLQKIIQERLDVIRHQMDEWKYEARQIVEEAIDKKSDALNQKLLGALETRIQEKTSHAMEDLRSRVKEEIAESVENSLKAVKDQTERGLAQTRALAFAGLGLASLTLVGVAILWLGK